jgi:hypothetical protein
VVNINGLFPKTLYGTGFYQNILSKKIMGEMIVGKIGLLNGLKKNKIWG